MLAGLGMRVRDRSGDFFSTPFLNSELGTSALAVQWVVAPYLCVR